MKLAIMQPYFFPYIGYWQLLNTVDRFVIYDDVNYINRGWINRNRILINGEPSYITVPLNKASQNKRICDISLQPSLAWRDKLIRKVETTYRNAPHFIEVFPVIETLISHQVDNLSDYLSFQLVTLAEFMGITTEFVLSSRRYDNSILCSQERILDICNREGATVYINPQSGQTLYDSETFRSAGINLRFLVMHPVPYKQRSAGFVPYLSAIDALMEMGARDATQQLDNYELIETT